VPKGAFRIEILDSRVRGNDKKRITQQELIKRNRRGKPRPSASVSVYNQRGVSPLQANVLRLVAEGNCVVVRPGGEQPEAKGQSVGDELDSAWVT
jgi:hypothetical protein